MEILAIHPTHNMARRPYSAHAEELQCQNCWYCTCHHAGGLELPCTVAKETQVSLESDVKPDKEMVEFFLNNPPIRVNAVPLVYYGNNHEHRVIGSAVVKDGSVSAIVTDQDVREMILGDNLKYVSLGFSFKVPQEVTNGSGDEQTHHTDSSGGRLHQEESREDGQDT